MTRDEIFQLIRNNVIEVLGDKITPEDITIEKRLVDLGANSIDRGEIVVMTMEDVGVKVPLVELGKAKNIQDLIEILYESKNSQVAGVVMQASGSIYKEQ